ncbi:MAG: hypothetical protein JXO22_13060 [Phycisphaerae bacterium]|nr:hypothetical protein [Phycisphaerae bacterium]
MPVSDFVDRQEPPPERVTRPESAKHNQGNTLTFYGSALKSMRVPVAVIAADDRV